MTHTHRKFPNRRSHTTPRQSPTRTAFTLMEVLVALGIFAIGFVAVAAIFPTAALLQKKTVDDVVVQQVTRNVQAVLGAKGLRLDLVPTPPPTSPPPANLGYLWGQINQAAVGTTTWDTDQRVYPLPPAMLSDSAPSTSPEQKWFLQDRSYPSSINPPEQRKIFWVPFVRDTDPTAGVNASDVVVYVFILGRSPGANYRRADLPASDWANPDDEDTVPGVARQIVTSVEAVNGEQTVFVFGPDNNYLDPANTSLGYKVNLGDQILDCYGGVHEVKDADENGVTVGVNDTISGSSTPGLEIWYARPDARGKQPTFGNLLTLTGVVK